MQLSIPIILFIGLLCQVCVSQVLPYQSHSFNDLDYIAQHLVKGTKTSGLTEIIGVDAYKIDINAIDRDSCLQYSTWKNSDNPCDIDEYSIEICCLGLRGDTSSSPKLNDYFNTTNDLITFLNNTKYDFIWQKQNRLSTFNRTIYIVMNIQYTYVQGLVTKGWLSKMIQTIQQRDLDIVLVLGNPADVLDYYGELCQNQSVKCDQEAQTIASYPFILQSFDFYNASFGLVENFNTNFSLLPSFCANGFPSFGDPLPYFIYEVAHEEDIQFIANTYMSNQCQRRSTHPDLSSIRMTSNIDPEMLQNYLPGNNPLSSLTTASNVLVDTLEEDQSILLSYFDTNQQPLDNSCSNLVSEVQINGSAITKMSYKSSFLLLHNQEQAQVYEVSATSPLSLQSLYTISTPGITSDIVFYNNNLYIVQVEVGQGCPAGTLSFTLGNLNLGKQLFSQCSSATNLFDVNQIQNADLALVIDSTNTLTGLLFVSAPYNSTLGQTKDAIFSFSVTSNFESVTITTPKSYIDLGVDPTVKIIQNNSTFFVLEAHSNGICQCADFINNGNMFKCGLPDTNNLHVGYLQNVKYSLNYNWGRLDDYVNRIQSGQYLSSCDSTIMHAKFYNGASPSGTVFRNNSTGALQALFVNQYVDYFDLPFVTKLFCGATLPQANTGGSVVANSFNILDFFLFNYL